MSALDWFEVGVVMLTGLAAVWLAVKSRTHRDRQSGVSERLDESLAWQQPGFVMLHTDLQAPGSSVARPDFSQKAPRARI